MESTSIVREIEHLRRIVIPRDTGRNICRGKIAYFAEI